MKIWFITTTFSGRSGGKINTWPVLIQSFQWQTNKCSSLNWRLSERKKMKILKKRKRMRTVLYSQRKSTIDLRTTFISATRKLSSGIFQSTTSQKVKIPGMPYQWRFILIMGSTIQSTKSSLSIIKKQRQRLKTLNFENRDQKLRKMTI